MFSLYVSHLFNSKAMMKYFFSNQKIPQERWIQSDKIMTFDE